MQFRFCGAVSVSVAVRLISAVLLLKTQPHHRFAVAVFAVIVTVSVFAVIGAVLVPVRFLLTPNPQQHQVDAPPNQLSCHSEV